MHSIQRQNVSYTLCFNASLPRQSPLRFEVQQTKRELQRSREDAAGMGELPASLLPRLLVAVVVMCQNF